MRVRAKTNLVFKGKSYKIGDEFTIDKVNFPFIQRFVEVIEQPEQQVVETEAEEQVKEDKPKKRRGRKKKEG